MIQINPQVIREYEKKRKISERKLVDIVETSRMTFRKWMKQEQMPRDMLDRVCRTLDIPPKEIMRGRTVWMRLGVRVQVTEEEFKDILKKGYNGTSFKDVNFETGSEWHGNEFLERALADGESYIPGCCLEYEIMEET